jgi:hypothetical protein
MEAGLASLYEREPEATGPVSMRRVVKVRPSKAPKNGGLIR